MTPKLLTVSWGQYRNDQGGREHLAVDGKTLCGHPLPERGYREGNHPDPQWVLKNATDLALDGWCLWCLRKLKKSAEAMAEEGQ